MEFWRKADIETSLKSNLWFLPFGLTTLQIVIYSTVKILQKLPGAFTFNKKSKNESP